jgi:hypothetical protein
MAVSLVESITLIPKSQEASFQKGAELSKVMGEQVSNLQRMDQQTLHNGSQTVRKNETDSPEYSYDASEEGKNKQRYSEHQSGKRKHDEKDSSKQQKSISGSTFDIRI